MTKGRFEGGSVQAKAKFVEQYMREVQTLSRQEVEIEVENCKYLQSILESIAVIKINLRIKMAEERSIRSHSEQRSILSSRKHSQSNSEAKKSIFNSSSAVLKRKLEGNFSRERRLRNTKKDDSFTGNFKGLNSSYSGASKPNFYRSRALKNHLPDSRESSNELRNGQKSVEGRFRSPIINRLNKKTGEALDLYSNVNFINRGSEPFHTAHKNTESLTKSLTHDKFHKLHKKPEFSETDFRSESMKKASSNSKVNKFAPKVKLEKIDCLQSKTVNSQPNTKRQLVTKKVFSFLNNQKTKEPKEKGEKETSKVIVPPNELVVVQEQVFSSTMINISRNSATPPASQNPKTIDPFSKSISVSKTSLIDRIKDPFQLPAKKNYESLAQKVVKKTSALNSPRDEFLKRAQALKPKPINLRKASLKEEQTEYSQKELPIIPMAEDISPIRFHQNSKFSNGVKNLLSNRDSLGFEDPLS